MSYICATFDSFLRLVYREAQFWRKAATFNFPRAPNISDRFYFIRRQLVDNDRTYHDGMLRKLDGVKVGDWLRINVSGIQKLERVKRVSGLVVETDSYRFTRYGHTWPKPLLSIMAGPASKDEVERWLEQRS